MSSDGSFWKLSRKCRYALRALFELAWRGSDEPVSVQTIAAAQNVPARFLEVILNELKRSGLVESRRGSDGGYLLSGRPDDMTVGQVLRVLGAVAGTQPPRRAGRTGYVRGDEALGLLQARVDRAISEVCDGTSFLELVAEERRLAGQYVPEYVI